MSYAIVRNEKLTRAEINGKGTHNDRKAKNHTNKDIDPTRTHLNYYIKKNELTYTKEFDKYLKENNIQGHLRSNSIIMCQMIFTSDQAFFDNIGEKLIRNRLWHTMKVIIDLYIFMKQGTCRIKFRCHVSQMDVDNIWLKHFHLF